MARHDYCCAPRTLCTWGLASLIVVAGASAWTQRADAQQYKQLKPARTLAEWNALNAKIGPILRSPTAPGPADLKIVEDGLMGYYLPAMTFTSPESLGSLAELRKNLFLRYINFARSQPARDLVVSLTMKQMGPVAVGAFHPAVRYNAVLIMGQLDQQPAGAGAAPPKPLAAATNALAMLLERDEFNGVAVPSSVKIAALVGLDRHTRFGVDPQFNEKITTAALAMANRAKPPEDISAEVNDWMRALAARVLANQFAKGFTPPVHQAFVSMLADKDMHLDERCRVAEMITPVMYEGIQGVDAGQIADALGSLAVAVLADERKAAEDYQEAMVGGVQGFGGGGRGGDSGFGGGGGRFGGGRGRGGGDGGGFVNPLEDTGPHFERRRTLDRIMAVIAGATAIGAGGSGDVKQRMADLITPMQQTADKITDAKTTELDASDTVMQLADTVGGIVTGWAAAAPGDEAAPADEAPADGDVAARAGDGF